jgi:hypothetical protein
VFDGFLLGDIKLPRPSLRSASLPVDCSTPTVHQMAAVLSLLLFATVVLTDAQEDCNLEAPIALDPPLDHDPLITQGFILSDTVRDIVTLDGFAFELSTGSSNTDSNDNFRGFPVRISGVGAHGKSAGFTTGNGFFTPMPEKGNLWNFFPDRSREPWLPDQAEYTCKTDWGRVPNGFRPTWFIKGGLSVNIGRKLPEFHETDGTFVYEEDKNGRLLTPVLPPWFVDLMVEQFNVPATLFVLPLKHRQTARYEAFYGIDPSDGSLVDPGFVPHFNEATKTFTSYTKANGGKFGNVRPRSTWDSSLRGGVPHPEYKALMRWLDRYPIIDVPKSHFLKAVNASIKIGWGDMDDRRSDGSPMWTADQREKVKNFYDTFIRLYGGSAQQAAEAQAGGSTFGSAGAQKKRAALKRCDIDIYKFGLKSAVKKMHPLQRTLPLGSLELAVLINQFIGQHSNKGPWSQRENREAVNMMHRRLIRKSLCSDCAFTLGDGEEGFVFRVEKTWDSDGGALGAYWFAIKSWWERWLLRNFAVSPLTAKELWGKDSAGLICGDDPEIPAFRQGRLGSLSIQDAVLASRVRKGPVSAQFGIGVFKTAFGTWGFDKRKTLRDIIVSPEIDTSNAQRRVPQGQKQPQSVRVPYTGKVVARWLRTVNPPDERLMMYPPDVVNAEYALRTPFRGEREGDLYLQLNENPVPCAELNQRQPRVADERRIVCGNENPHCLCLIGESKQGTNTPILRIAFDSPDRMRKFQQEVQNLFDRLRRRSTFKKRMPPIAAPALPLLQPPQQAQLGAPVVGAGSGGSAADDDFVVVDSLKEGSPQVVIPQAAKAKQPATIPQQVMVIEGQSVNKGPAASGFDDESLLPLHGHGKEERGLAALLDEQALHQEEALAERSRSLAGSRRSASKIVKAGNQQQSMAS